MGGVAARRANLAAVESLLAEFRAPERRAESQQRRRIRQALARERRVTEAPADAAPVPAEGSPDGASKRRGAELPRTLRGLLNFIRQSPDHVGAYISAAKALQNKGRIEAAETLLNEASGRIGESMPLLAAKARLLAASGSFEAALDLLRASPERTRTAAVIAGLLLDAHRLDEAELELAKLDRTDDGEIDGAWRLRAKLQLLRNRPQDALRTVEGVTDPDVLKSKTYAYFLSSLYLAEAGDSARAWDILSQAVGGEFSSDPIIAAYFSASAPRRLRLQTWVDLHVLGRAARLDPARVAPLEQMLAARIAERRPTSLIRMADGEGRVLGGRDPAIGGATFCASRQGGLSPGSLAEFNAMFRKAVLEADILGLPTEDMLHNADNRAIIRALGSSWVERIAGGEVIVTDHGCHWYLEMAGSFRRLLEGLPFVGVLSGRDVTPVLRSQFGVADAQWYAMPPQATHGGLAERPHYPDRFNEVVRSLHVPFDGAVFLIAAGQVGKVYCGEVKRRGGIAIDIGAVADAWMGLDDTRPFTAANPEVVRRAAAPRAA